MNLTAEHGASRVSLPVIVREWGRIGCIGFGGPPAHIALLRKLCVDSRGWLSAEEFEDGIAATNLLPGPASTQLAIFCAWRVAGPAGAILGGACFILPGLIVILALSALFLATHPPVWVEGAAAGAGAAVPAVAVQAALGLAPASWRRATGRSGIRRSGARWSGLRWPDTRWLGYIVIGGAAGALAGPYLVFVLAGCGAAELIVRTRRHPSAGTSTAETSSAGTSTAGTSTAETSTAEDTSRGGNGGGAGGRLVALLPVALVLPVATGGLLAVAWVALKVGALSYGGGFVIIPLMQHDVVHTYHWMTGAQFLSAVALGQVTPGPVVQTVAVVGYAAAGVGGGVLASFIAFLPSFVFVLVGGPRFGLLRANAGVQAFLTGAGPAAIGAIAGSAIPLAFDLAHLWQFAVLGLSFAWLLALRRNLVIAIIGAAGLGVIAALAGAPIG